MAANTYRPQRQVSNKRSISKPEYEIHHWLQKIGERKKTAEELISIIISEIEAPPLYYKKANEISNHLKQIIKFFYRNLDVKVELFGSSVTNLAIKGSDVDVFLNFGGNLPKPPEVLVGSLKNQVRKFGYFIRSIPIFATIPIVKCVHRNRMSCDLSFSNSCGVINSFLIKFLLKIDERLRPLILILKFLMKSQGLVGCNALSSFSILCLIFFFLQALEDPIIPPVCFLQSLSPTKEIVENWDVSFTTEVSHLPPIKNQLPVIELLQKFFEFYSVFEFGFYIISLFTAKKYLKPIFSDQTFLPKEFHLYKSNLAKDKSYKFDCNKFMCVQGPFNHNANITRNVTQKSLVMFQNFCCINAAVGQEFLKGDKLEENKVKYLMKLFDQESEISKKKRLKTEDVIIFVGENIIFDNCNCTEEDLRNEWSKSIFNKVKDILCKVMKCDIDVHDKGSGDESTTFANNEKLINCEFHYHGLLTKKRHGVKSEINFPSNISTIEKEEIISDYLCDTVLKDAKKAFLKFTIICCVKKKPTCFCMALESKEAQKGNIHSVLQIFQFIQDYFPKWIK